MYKISYCTSGLTSQRLLHLSGNTSFQCFLAYILCVVTLMFFMIFYCTQLHTFISALSFTSLCCVYLNFQFWCLLDEIIIKNWTFKFAVTFLGYLLLESTVSVNLLHRYISVRSHCGGKKIKPLASIYVPEKR